MTRRKIMEDDDDDDDDEDQSLTDDDLDYQAAGEDDEEEGQMNDDDSQQEMEIDEHNDDLSNNSRDQNDESIIEDNNSDNNNVIDDIDDNNNNNNNDNDDEEKEEEEEDSVNIARLKILLEQIITSNPQDDISEIECNDNDLYDIMYLLYVEYFVIPHEKSKQFIFLLNQSKSLLTQQLNVYPLPDSLSILNYSPNEILSSQKHDDNDQPITPSAAAAVSTIVQAGSSADPLSIPYDTRTNFYNSSFISIKGLYDHATPVFCEEFAWRAFGLEKSNYSNTYEDIDQAFRDAKYKVLKLYSIFLTRQLLYKVSPKHSTFLETPESFFSRLLELLSEYRSVITSTWRIQGFYGLQSDTSIPPYVELQKYSSFHENDDSLKDYQLGLHTILEKLKRKRYRKRGSDCYQEKRVFLSHPTNPSQGRHYGTRSWVKVCSISEFIYSSIDRTGDYELWKLLTTATNTIREIEKNLTQAKDSGFPELQPNRYMFAFKNGIYHVYYNTFMPYNKTPEQVVLVDKEYLNSLETQSEKEEYLKELTRLKRDLSHADCCRYIDQEINLTWFFDDKTKKRKRSNSTVEEIPSKILRQNDYNSSSLLSDALFEKEKEKEKEKESDQEKEEEEEFDVNEDILDDEINDEDNNNNDDDDKLDKIMNDNQPKLNDDLSTDHLDDQWIKDTYFMESIPTPAMDAILDYQQFTLQEGQNFENPKLKRELKLWIFALFGRMLYDLRAKDDWQILLYIRGAAGTGKSSIATALRNIYNREDVGEISNTVQADFGLDGLEDKLIWLCPETKENFKLPQTTLQQMISGETIGFNRKHKQSASVEWKAAGYMSGNHLPNWVNCAGSMSRRIVLLLFSRTVTNGDPRLSTKLLQETGAFIVKSNMAYIWAYKKYGHKLFWEFAPKYFRDNQKTLETETNSLEFFLKLSGECEFAPDDINADDEDSIYQTEKGILEKRYVQWAKEHKRTTINLNDNQFVASTFANAGLKIKCKERSGARGDSGKKIIVGVHLLRENTVYDPHANNAAAITN